RRRAAALRAASRGRARAGIAAVRDRRAAPAAVGADPDRVPAARDPGVRSAALPRPARQGRRRERPRTAAGGRRRRARLPRCRGGAPAVASLGMSELMPPLGFDRRALARNLLGEIEPATVSRPAWRTAVSIGGGVPRERPLTRFLCLPPYEFRARLR